MPSAADLDDLLAVLGGRGLPQRDLLAELAERQSQVELMTERQAAILDALRLLHRVEVRGGAGSGKTWLAVEQARRLAREGKRVALTCYSRGLAAHLQRAAGFRRRERPAYVGTFHGLGLEWGAPTGSDDDSAFWEERLPAAMLDLARGLPEAERYDAVVVDEAQDFADGWWAPLLAALRDSEDGGVYVFADEGQRVFARQGRPPVSLVPVVLDENLRNTVPIALTIGSLTTAQMRYRGGEGPPVRFVPCAAEEAVDRADEEVERLVEAEGWPVDSVALLTTGRRHPVQVERQRAGQDEYWAGYYDDGDVFYGHVLGFKGLERPSSSRSTASGSTTSGRGRSCTSGCRGRGTCWSCAATWRRSRRSAGRPSYGDSRARVPDTSRGREAAGAAGLRPGRDPDGPGGRPAPAPTPPPGGSRGPSIPVGPGRHTAALDDDQGWS